MKSNILFLVAGGIALLGSQSLFAQDFSFTLSKAKSVDYNVYEATVNDAAFIDHIERDHTFSLTFNDLIYEQRITHVQNLSNGFSGVYSQKNNEYASNSHLIYRDGKLSGLMHFDNKAYSLVSGEDSDEYRLLEIPETVHSCSIEEFKETGHLKGIENTGFEMPYMDISNFSDSTTVDVLLIYTTDAKNWAANSEFVTDINHVIALNEGFKNLILSNSDIALKIRFVGFVEIGNNSATSDNTILNSMNENTYPGEDIHALQNQYGADLVALMEEYTFDGGGLGNRPGYLGGSPNSGHSVNRVQQLYFTYTLMHEIGHNFGNGHGRTQQSNAAGQNGGMFEFSTGHALVGSDDENYTSVMHYSTLTDGTNSIEIPWYSNPRLEYLSTPLGSTNESSAGGPSDNALSMSITKDWIASYRLPVVDPPAMSVNTSEIAETISPTSSSTKQIMITNNGDSDLEVTLDGRIDFSSALAKTSTEPALDVTFGFESSEGFNEGAYSGHNNWLSTSEAAEFDISTERVFSGDQSLKISLTENYPSIRSPYFSEFARYADYTITFKVYLEGGNSNLIIGGSSSEGSVAEVWLQNSGSIGFLGNNQGNKSYWSFGGDSYTTGQWYDVEIGISPENNGTINYTFGSISRSFTNNGVLFPEEFGISIQGTGSGVAYIDDIEISASQLYGPSLDITDRRTTIEPGQTGSLEIEFSGNNNAEGTYTGTLDITSNDPVNTTESIPVTLTIDSDFVTSVEPETLPSSYKLDQNYPNPFNPETNINFGLPADSFVELTVYNLVEQKIRTLVNSRVAAGNHTVSFDASEFSSGVYIYRIEADGYVATRKMMLVK